MLGHSVLPVCPRVHLSAALPKPAAPLGRKRLRPPCRTCAGETENWILCLIHLYCNDVYNLVVFHYLIFKKPILLVFYMKKILQKVTLCCIFPKMLCVRVAIAETLSARFLYAGNRVCTGYFCISR